MIYHLIKSTVPPFSLSESWGEKMKCELLLRHFPLMQMPLFSLLSNPALGSIESPVSILSLGLIKHIHSVASYPIAPHLLAFWDSPKKPCSHQACKTSHARVTKSHVKISVNKASSQDTQKSSFIRTEEIFERPLSKMKAIRLKWINGVQVWQGYRRPKDFVLWFVT